MHHRPATLADTPLLAAFNYQLIRDEGHRNPMTVPELEVRMRGWLASGLYRGEVFYDGREAVAYALFREGETDIELRHFFVARHRRREGLGRRAMHLLFDEVWPRRKRRTVSVLTRNEAGVAFWRALGYSDYALTLEILPPDR
jgi:GNAT superfamily N-acetyltransferase